MVLIHIGQETRRLPIPEMKTTLLGLILGFYDLGLASLFCVFYLGDGSSRQAFF